MADSPQTASPKSPTAEEDKSIVDTSQVTLPVASTAEEEAVVEPDMEVSKDDGFLVVAEKTAVNKRRRVERRRTDASLNDIQDDLPFRWGPSVTPLGLGDVDSCVALEDASFDENQRCSREKFEYRLTVCPELSLGVFCTVPTDKADQFQVETLKAAKPVETDRKDGDLRVLVAHIVATRSSDETVTDNSMAYPKDWRSGVLRKGGGCIRDELGNVVGHEEGARTLCLHSLAVLPRMRGMGVGKLIMKQFLQQMRGAGIADRVALICQEHLIPYYEKFGYKSQGPSKATFGGGGWFDMVFSFKKEDHSPSLP